MAIYQHAVKLKSPVSSRFKNKALNVIPLLPFAYKHKDVSHEKLLQGSVRACQ